MFAIILIGLLLGCSPPPPPDPHPCADLTDDERAANLVQERDVLMDHSYRLRIMMHGNIRSALEYQLERAENAIHEATGQYGHPGAVALAEKWRSRYAALDLRVQDATDRFERAAEDRHARIVAHRLTGVCAERPDRTPTRIQACKVSDIETTRLSAQADAEMQRMYAFYPEAKQAIILEVEAILNATSGN